MPRHLKDHKNHIAEGCHIPGILTLNASMSNGQTIDELIEAAETAFDDEFRDRIDFLPAS